MWFSTRLFTRKKRHLQLLVVIHGLLVRRKKHLRSGLRPEHRWDSLQRSPDHLADGKRLAAPSQVPLTHSLPSASNFGASGVPPETNSWLRRCDKVPTVSVDAPVCLAYLDDECGSDEVWVAQDGAVGSNGHVQLSSVADEGQRDGGVI